MKRNTYDKKTNSGIFELKNSLFHLDYRNFNQCANDRSILDGTEDDSIDFIDEYFKKI